MDWAHIIRAATIFVAGYDFLIVPFTVLRRTRSDRCWPVELTYCFGLDLILLGIIMRVAQNWSQTVHVSTVLWLAGSVLVAVGSHRALAIWNRR